MSRKTSGIISLVLNLLTFILTGWAISQFFVSVGSGNMTVRGSECFKFFTIDSNILAAVASLFLLPREIKRAAGKEIEIPRWLLILKFAGTVSVTVTFIVVMVFLGPNEGFARMFEKGNLFLHGICPVFALVSFLFFDDDHSFSVKDSIPALLPVFIYGTLYFVMVIILTETNGGWKDFYGFNRNGMWPISITVMFIFNVILVFALRKLKNRLTENSRLPH